MVGSLSTEPTTTTTTITTTITTITTRPKRKKEDRKKQKRKKEEAYLLLLFTYPQVNIIILGRPHIRRVERAFSSFALSALCVCSRATEPRSLRDRFLRPPTLRLLPVRQSRSFPVAECQVRAATRSSLTIFTFTFTTSLPPLADIIISLEQNNMAARPTTPASPKDVKIKSPVPGTPLFGCGQ